MTLLIVIRPQPGADATAAAARDMGLAARLFPLFAIAPVAWTPPEPTEIDALLIGSANAVRHAGPALAAFAGKPVYAVGQATAAACRAAGLTVAAIGTGGLDGVLGRITDHARLLRLAGREHVALTVPPGITLSERIVYASLPQPVPPELAALLGAPAVVLLHSAAAAEHFAAECSRLGIARNAITLATIGPRVTAVCGEGWAEVVTAASPDDAALLAQARHLCQNRDGTPELGEEHVKGAMQDEYLSQPRSARSTGAGRAILAVGLLAFVLGAVLSGWVAWRSGMTLDRVLGREEPRAAATVPPAAPTPSVLPPLTANPVIAQGGFDQRLAGLEQRLAQLDLQAQAVSGNTSRAEGLLIAFATRRMIDRGSPLGYLEDQLRVRFADSQPNAVATIISAAQRPMTLDQLATQLQAMAPALANAPQDDSGWQKVSRGFSNLFVIRSENRAAPDPSNRIARAQLLLRQGQADAAVLEVRQLPGAAGAANWIAAAQRYAATQRALDQIESTALIAPLPQQQAQVPGPLAPPVVTPRPVPGA